MPRCFVYLYHQDLENKDAPVTLSPFDDAAANALAKLLPPDTLRPSSPHHLEEPRGRWQGHSSHVALPRNTQEVATVVTFCAQNHIGLIPYGGGTGLVGGQVAPEGPAPLLLSLERMTAIRATYPLENAMIVEAGAILADVQSAAEDQNRLFPLSLASEGSARIGGLLACNAGGTNVLRYGNARDLVLGLEAVLPDGQIWNGLKRLRKDNTGYDLRHLLLGSEGTLGVITAASLKLFPRPAAQGTALLEVTSPKAALDLLAMARDQLGDCVTGFELMHRTGFDFLTECLPDIRQPWPMPPEWSVLLEISLPRGLAPLDCLTTLLSDAIDKNLVTDGLIAQSQSQAADFWSLREHIPLANRAIGAISSHDISLPLSAIPEFVAQAGSTLSTLGDIRINCFGHLGDGNLHYNVFPAPGRDRSDLDALRDQIKTTVHDLVDAMDGSFSAEHGIGRLKTADLERYGDPAKLAAMRAIKSALDPNGIMNPGAVLRPL